jgi:hypothetical protein
LTDFEKQNRSKWRSEKFYFSVLGGKILFTQPHTFRTPLYILNGHRFSDFVLRNQKNDVHSKLSFAAEGSVILFTQTQFKILIDGIRLQRISSYTLILLILQSKINRISV